MRVLAHLPLAARVLDVGCNTGELGAQMKALRGCYVVGVEKNPAYRDLAVHRLDEIIIADVMDLPKLLPPNCQFDAVVAADVLEHLPNPWAAVRLLSGYLRWGGAHDRFTTECGQLCLAARIVEGDISGITRPPYWREVIFAFSRSLQRRNSSSKLD